jgi:hypothetical protein
MNARKQEALFNSIFVATARAAEPCRLMAPRPVKAITEHSTAAENAESPLLALSNLPRPDRHFHSLGYGIDE